MYNLGQIDHFYPFNVKGDLLEKFLLYPQFWLYLLFGVDTGGAVVDSAVGAVVDSAVGGAVVNSAVGGAVVN